MDWKLSLRPMQFAICPLQTFLGLSRVSPHERLLSGRATSVQWLLAFVSKEPIHCSVNVDIFVVCVPGCLPCVHARYLLFEGQNAEKKDFSVKCCLLAFNIVALRRVFH